MIQIGAIQVGMIGTGFMGRIHAAILKQDPRAKITAFYDANTARAEEAAAEFGGKAVSSLEELWHLCEAVYICAPNVRHGELALQAIAARKHVFCEKPMCTELDAAERVAESALHSPRIFQVGHNRRFAHVYSGAREAMVKLGPALCAEIKMNRGELEKPPWTADAGVTGGFLFETPVHMLDMAQWLFGPLREVYARGGQRVYQQEDTFSVLMSFDRLHCTLTTCAYTGWSFPFERVEIYGKNYTIRTEEMDTLSVNGELQDFREPSHELSREARWGYVEEDRLFLEAIAAGGPAPVAAVTAMDGLASVRAVDAVYRSLREGCAVKLK
jgi:myo-inositol 2-dehydrogenase/D-chiro-inositol 1-dehydrogenase